MAILESTPCNFPDDIKFSILFNYKDMEGCFFFHFCFHMYFRGYDEFKSEFPYFIPFKWTQLFCDLGGYIKSLVCHLNNRVQINPVQSNLIALRADFEISFDGIEKLDLSFPSKGNEAIENARSI